MAIFTFGLGILLAVGGAGWLVAALSLAPTEMGLTDALCGAVALSAGVVTLAIGALVNRLDALVRAIEGGASREPRRDSFVADEPIVERDVEPVLEPALESAEDVESDEPVAVEPPVVAEAPAVTAVPAFVRTAVVAEAAGAVEEAVSVEAGSATEEPLNENRAGRLPTLAAIEHAIAEPEAAPSLVGRYSSGGANYRIFSDGSIEAETEEGAFKFASMSDFKAYLAGQRG